MKRINLSCSAKPFNYQILIGKELLLQPQIFAPCLSGRSVFIVSNQTVAPLYLEQLKSALSEHVCYSFLLPDGEQYKNFEHWQAMLNEMVAAGLKRNDTVIALGGGVVGDMAGFAAAVYNRGIDVVQVPTTLLSQVDSSVGGKTAINLAEGKNLIGSFHQPKLVVVDTATLSSLPKRQLLAGISEVVKASIIADADFFSWLEANYQSILKLEQSCLESMIEKACQIKAEIVQQDATEQGVRAWLNLGHTFGHVIERCAGYGTILHGEAVAIGTCLAARFALEQQRLSESACQRIKRLFSYFGLPTRLPEDLAATDLVNAMTFDKKNANEKLTLILPESIGKVRIEPAVEPSLVESFLRQQIE